jgi:hypothetical protein
MKKAKQSIENDNRGSNEYVYDGPFLKFCESYDSDNDNEFWQPIQDFIEKKRLFPQPIILMILDYFGMNLIDSIIKRASKSVANKDDKVLYGGFDLPDPPKRPSYSEAGYAAYNHLMSGVLIKGAIKELSSFRYFDLNIPRKKMVDYFSQYSDVSPLQMWQSFQDKTHPFAEWLKVTEEFNQTGPMVLSMSGYGEKMKFNSINAVMTLNMVSGSVNLSHRFNEEKPIVYSFLVHLPQDGKNHWLPVLFIAQKKIVKLYYALNVVLFNGYYLLGILQLINKLFDPGFMLKLSQQALAEAKKIQVDPKNPQIEALVKCWQTLVKDQALSSLIDTTDLEKVERALGPHSPLAGPLKQIRDRFTTLGSRSTSPVATSAAHSSSCSLL